METVDTVEDAVRAAEHIGYPVVVKASAGEIVHKSDARLVRTGLRDARDVRAAAGDLLAALGAGSPLLVQQQVAGPELAVGITRDERFGPLVMVASGGVNLDLWQDQAFLMTPLRRTEIRDALRSLRTFPLLDGLPRRRTGGRRGRRGPRRARRQARGRAPGGRRGGPQPGRVHADRPGLRGREGARSARHLTAREEATGTDPTSLGAGPVALPDGGHPA